MSIKMSLIVHYLKLNERIESLSETVNNNDFVCAMKKLFELKTRGTSEVYVCV